MATFIIYLGQNNKLSEKKVNELVARHETAQDTVLVKPVDEIIEGGFKVLKEDDIAANVLKRDSEAAKKSIDKRVMDRLAKERSVIADGAKISGDTSITDGARPYKPAGKKKAKSKK